MTTSQTSDGGSKYDGDKPRLDLVPGEAVLAMGRAFTYGANKYEAHNWRKGIKHSRLYAACLRHLTAYWMGETHDPESGLSHIDHAMANLAMLISTTDKDDRFKEED